MMAVTDAVGLKHFRRGNKYLRVILWIAVLLFFVWLIVLTRYFLFPPPPAHFIKAQILTPYVSPTGRNVGARSPGNVRLMAWVEAPQNDKCMVATNYIMEFADGTVSSLPGMRISTKGEVRVTIYEVSIPRGATVGKADFYVRDTYVCGAQTKRVESPRLPVTVGPTITGTWSFLPYSTVPIAPSTQ